MSNLQQQLKKNIEAFHEVEDQLRKTSPGKFALMHNGEIVHMFTSREDALMIGRGRYAAGEFSISPKIGAPPVNLGTAALYVTPMTVE